jgi:hypothetical protein
VIMLKLFIHQDIHMANMISHLECHRDKKNFKEENELIIIINVSSLKTQSVVWIMTVIEEGSTRAWPQ